MRNSPELEQALQNLRAGDVITGLVERHPTKPGVSRFWPKLRIYVLHRHSRSHWLTLSLASSILCVTPDPHGYYVFDDEAGTLVCESGVPHNLIGAETRVEKRAGKRAAELYRKRPKVEDIRLRLTDKQLNMYFQRTAEEQAVMFSLLLREDLQEAERVAMLADIVFPGERVKPRELAILQFLLHQVALHAFQQAENAQARVTQVRIASSKTAEAPVPNELVPPRSLH